MDLEDYKKLIKDCERKIQRKRDLIRTLVFIVLFVFLSIFSYKYSWAETLGGNILLAFFLSIYPGFLLWAWDFDTILKYSRGYNRLSAEIKKYNEEKIGIERVAREEREKIEEAARFEKNKQGVAKLKKLEAIYESIFNRRIAPEYFGEYEEFISIVGDLSINNYYFDYETRREFELLNKYSKQLKNRIVSSSSNKKIGTVKLRSGNGDKAISNEVDNTIDQNNEQIVRLANIEDFKNKYNQYKIRESRDDWRSGRKIKIDYLKKNLQNTNLGLQGELIVLKWEKDNLIEGGMGDLAEKVRHISQEIGDGAGFDILSYDENGNEKFIEVKTTKSGLSTQFYFSDGELNFIKNTQNYYLYRLNLENEDEAELTIISKDEFLNKFEIIPYQYTVKFKTE